MSDRVSRLVSRFSPRDRNGVSRHQEESSGGPADGCRRTTFIDDSVNQSLTREGFAVLPERLDNSSVQALTALYEGVIAKVGKDSSGFFRPSMMISDPIMRARLWDGVREITAPTIDPLFVPGTSAVMGGSFVSKPPAENSARNPHQDPSVFDENDHVSISIWIPLIDSDTSNGTLFCLPGSHRMGNHIRPPDVANFDEEVSNYSLEHSVPVTVAAGQMLVIDGAVIHHSPPNSSDRERVATIVAVRPSKSTMCLMRSEQGAAVGTAHLYDVGTEMFRSGNLIEPDLGHCEVARTVPYRPATMNDLNASLALCRRSQST